MNTVEVVKARKGSALQLECVPASVPVKEIGRQGHYPYRLRCPIHHGLPRRTTIFTCGSGVFESCMLMIRANLKGDVDSLELVTVTPAVCGISTTSTRYYSRAADSDIDLAVTRTRTWIVVAAKAESERSEPARLLRNLTRNY
jgi:hypothetical protein